MDKAKASHIIRTLDSNYPAARIELKFKSAWQLLVAVVLSAQSTDRQINKVTAVLFRDLPNVEDIKKVSLNRLEKYIYSAGFYRMKAKNIKKAATIICEKHNGKVPKTMEELCELPGVARKSANIVLSVCFDINVGIAVDTHVKRLSQRIGFTTHKDPQKIERDLQNIFHKKNWGKINYLLITHGRVICKASKPKCSDCVVKRNCRYFLNATQQDST